jgi:NTE family protein
MHSYALLDTAPLRDTVANGGYVEWSALPSKFEGTWLKAAGVVATEVSSGKSVVFVQGLRDGDLPAANVTRGIDYRPAKLGPDHVLASAAIPIAFPSVEIAGGAWFVDGGVRLNTPIAPAIDLLAKVAPAGKNRIVIVSTDPDPNRVSGVTARPIATNRRPDILDQAAAIMYSALVDRVAEDVLSLRRVNAAVQASADDSVADARGAGQSFEVVDHCYLGPPSRGHIARQAGETFRAGSYPPWSASFVFNLISHAIGNKGRAHDELLSFLFFDPDFLRALVKMGQDDADRLMVHGRLPWGAISPPGGST